jgi:hypothetical protein
MLSNLIAQKRLDSISEFQTLKPLRPSYCQISKIESVVDEHPYKNFFRGRIDDHPTVFDRRAGWSPQFMTQPKCPSGKYYPKHCFEFPCNTVFTLRDNCDGTCVKNNCIETYR